MSGQIGFGASFDIESSENGHSKNRHLKAVHQHLDNNLGKIYLINKIKIILFILKNKISN